MPLDVIKPDSHLTMQYPVPKKRRIAYEVEASVPVTTFVLDEEGLQQYNKRGSGDVTSYYGGFYHRGKHEEKITLPREFEGPWYLVVQNDSKKEYVAVRYEVFVGD